MTRHRTPSRPYARGKTPSVTTIINVLSKDGLAWGATKEAALFVVHQKDEWSHLSDEDAVERIRKHHDVMWKARAGIGTLLHLVNEAWSWDEDADLPELIKSMGTLPRLWVDNLDAAIAEVQPYVNGLERFWNDWMPETIETEEVVRQPDKPTAYIGQCDWRCTLGGQVWRLDLKSTAKSEEGSAFYTDSWRPQLAAYDRAPEVVYYDDKGTETGTAPNQRADRCGIVHLRGDGSYQLISVAADDEAFEAFMAMRRVYDWTKAHKRPPPVIVEAPSREAVAS